MKESILPEGIIDYAEKETDNGLHISYTLTEGSADGRCSYSIHAVQSGGESANLRDITSCKERARLMFNMICRGTVTPFGMAEAAEELIESILEDS